MKLGSRPNIVGTLLSAALILVAGGTLAAQSVAKPDKPQKEDKGYTLYEQFEGSSNTLGQVLKFDTTAGYNFNKFFGVDLGVSVYIVLASKTSTGTTAPKSTSGMGDVYTDLRLTVDNPLLNYASTLTGRAPTGSTQSGLSTGRATFEWMNHFDRGFLGLRPFVNLGVANSISDTHFFVRPFTTLGKVGEFEGGASYKLLHLVGVGASLYADEPWGTQKVFSKLVRRKETTGSASLARDNGFSAWFDASPVHFLDFELGYNRSIHYDLNTVSFSVGFNVGSLVKLGKHL